MLDFLSIDIGTILFTLMNTLILFLGLKRYLFAPVNAVLEQRRLTIEQSLREAEDAKIAAGHSKAAYEEKLSAAKEESAEMLRRTSRQAQRRAEEIVAAAKHYDPARITRFVIDLATLFHKFYNANRVKLPDNEPLMQARIAL